MAYRIQLKRGNKADLPTAAYPGEPLFCLDTGDFYIGTGEGILQMCRDARTFSQSSEPSSGMNPGDLWYDTTNKEMRRWNGSTWELMDVSVGSGSYAYAQDSAPESGMSAGDLWIDTNDSNKIYRYSGEEWVLMRDGGIASALQDAADALAAVDGKITSFYQDSPPAEGMEEGDIWFDTNDGNKIYIYETDTWVSRQDSDIAKAIQDAATAKGIADGKVATYFDETEPSTPAVGDLWYKESTNTFKRWNGTAWKKVATVNHTFSQGTPPASGMITGDIWIDTDDSNKFYRYDGSQWELLRDAGIAKALQDAADAQSTADGKIMSFYQDSAPTEGMSEGDIWFDTNDGNKIYIYETDTWVARQDSLIAQAVQDAATAQSTADGKIVTFYSTSTPTGMKAGDLWYNSDTMLLKRYVSGTTWETVSNSYYDPAHFTSDEDGLLFYDSMTKAVTLATGGVFKTAASPNPRIEITKDFIAGYSDATTMQFYLNASDGKAYAGGGAVTIDLDGIKLAQGTAKVNRIGWTSGASKVTGTDGAEYTCILAHVSTNDDRPVTGANWPAYWEKTRDMGVGYWQPGYYYHKAETDNITMLYGVDDPANYRCYTTLHTRGDYIGASAETRVQARCASGKKAQVALYANDASVDLSDNNGTIGFNLNNLDLNFVGGGNLHLNVNSVGHGVVYATRGICVGSSKADPGAIGNITLEGQLISSKQSGKAIIVDEGATGVCTNLNADMVDGKHAGGASGLATLDADGRVAFSSIQNVSATDKLLGRSSAGAGSIEEISCTAAGRALLDDANAAAQCTTLGLGTTDSPSFAGLTVSPSYSPVTIAGRTITFKASAGGWVQRLKFVGSADTERGSIGAYGTDDVLTRYYIGTYSTGELVSITADGLVGIGVTSPTYNLEIGCGGVRNIGVQRQTTSDTGGNNLLLTAGSAAVAGTNRNGGSLRLRPGLSTGSGYGQVQIYGCLGPGSGSSTTDGTYQELLTCKENKIGFFAGTPAVQQTLAAYTSDPESSAYTTTGSGADIASKADLNALRTAYETLRGMCEDLRTKILATTLITS